MAGMSQANIARWAPIRNSGGPDSNLQVDQFIVAAVLTLFFRVA